MQVTFQNLVCDVKFTSYQNNKRLAILLLNNGEPIATATVNLPDYSLAQDDVLIKDYSENAGIAKALADAGYIKRDQRFTANGYVMIEVCKLTDKSMQIASKTA
jgi:uncharacterized GH25 family protein